MPRGSLWGQGAYGAVWSAISLACLASCGHPRDKAAGVGGASALMSSHSVVAAHATHENHAATGVWRSGTRLKVLRVDADLAQPLPADAWDAALNVACKFRYGPDGALRCYPNSWTPALLPTVYADSQCTVALVVVCSPEKAGPVVAWREEASFENASAAPPVPFGIHFGLLGPRQIWPEGFYQKRSGRCSNVATQETPSGPSCDVYQLAKELVLGDFVRGDIVP